MVSLEIVFASLPLNVGVFLEVYIGSFEARHAGDETEVSEGQGRTSTELLSFEECVQELQSVFDLGQLVFVSGGATEHLWVLRNRDRISVTKIRILQVLVWIDLF